MKILFDTHTHTNASDHAFSTLGENMAFAKQKGLEGFALTNHAPALQDAPHIWHFRALHSIPRQADGLYILRGVEANIVDTDGNVDIERQDMAYVDVVIASMHTPVFPPLTEEEHTKTWINVIKNPLVDILGHSGGGEYKYDYRTVIKLAKEYDKCVEINNHSFDVRPGSTENCRLIAQLCKEIGAKIVVSSDAHICYEIGYFDTAIKMLEEIEFPEELIMNTTAEKFIKYIEGKRQKPLKP